MVRFRHLQTRCIAMDGRFASTRKDEEEPTVRDGELDAADGRRCKPGWILNPGVFAFLIDVSVSFLLLTLLDDYQAAQQQDGVQCYTRPQLRQYSVEHVFDLPTIPNMAVKTRSRKPLAKLLNGPTQSGFADAARGLGQVESV